jgi:hypothetical protein
MARFNGLTAWKSPNLFSTCLSSISAMFKPLAVSLWLSVFS